MTPSPVFVTTRWSVVLAARGETSPESAAALEAICRVYWFPLYAYARRCGHSAHDAQDLTQEFFCRLLDKQGLTSVDRDRGRLRTFLIVALKNFIANEWRRASAQRRGGHAEHVPIDTLFAENRLGEEASRSLSVDEIYDRQWALRLLELSLTRLREDFAASGREREWEVLKDCLMAARGAIDYRAIAAQLGSTEAATRVSVHRLRKRFREVYRDEIAQTLAPGTDLEEEMRHLATALARE